MSESNAYPATVDVGILTDDKICVCLHGRWKKEYNKCDSDDGQCLADKTRCGADAAQCTSANARCGTDDILCGSDNEMTLNEPCVFIPIDKDATFTLRNVMIGKQYHWQQCQDQTFSGSLRVIKEGNRLTAVNRIGVEQYLKSVISSEMSAEASLEFLKASAVISRSWLMRQITHTNATHSNEGMVDTADTIIRWQDHNDHTLYDVCADDHCQRYQGLTAITNEKAVMAVEETAGQVLTYNNNVCDCRFSKCCGGKTEVFSTCWQDEDIPYLSSVHDTDPKDGSILCDTEDEAILRQVLKDYDQHTHDFFSWTRHYTQSELRNLIEHKLHRNVGAIIEMRPLRRGPSGRISLMLLRGTQGDLTIGKELLIRSALSESHLLSSAFQVEAESCNEEGVPAGFTLKGKGWGHGVGMCQIGAAVMGARGYSYLQILEHYYPHTQVTHIDYTI